MYTLVPFGVHGLGKKCYNVYTEWRSVYMRYATIREFRAKIGDALDKVSSGERVFISRGDTEYELRLYEETYGSTAIVPNVIDKVVPNKSGVDEYGIPIFDDIPQKRRTIDILADIDVAKKAMQEEIDYCQDSETKYQIKSKHSVGINKLWEEYNEAKNGR